MNARPQQTEEQESFANRTGKGPDKIIKAGRGVQQIHSTGTGSSASTGNHAAVAVTSGRQYSHQTSPASRISEIVVIGWPSEARTSVPGRRGMGELYRAITVNLRCKHLMASHLHGGVP